MKKNKIFSFILSLATICNFTLAQAQDNNEKDYHITLIPDSIANNIIELDEKSKDGNSLIKVEIKAYFRPLGKAGEAPFIF